MAMGELKDLRVLLEKKRKKDVKSHALKSRLTVPQVRIYLDRAKSEGDAAFRKLEDWGVVSGVPARVSAGEIPPELAARMRNELLLEIEHGDIAKRAFKPDYPAKEDILSATPEELLAMKQILESFRLPEQSVKEGMPGQPSEYPDKQISLNSNLLSVQVAGVRIVLDVNDGGLTTNFYNGMTPGISDPSRALEKFVSWLREKIREGDLMAKRALDKITGNGRKG